MGEINGWDPTDASNVDLWPEGMLGGQINDAGRAMQGAVARWHRDISGFLAAGGSSNAFTLTSSRTIVSLTDGLLMTFRANHAITGATTLNLNSLGAKDIKRFNGNALAQGDIISGQPVMVLYSSALDDWLMVSAPAALTGNQYVDLDENGSPGTPATGDRRIYASPDGYVAARNSSGDEAFMWAPATQANMVAATSEDVVVTPAVQHFHPGHLKARGRVNSSGTLLSGYNVASVARNSTGLYTVTFTNAMANTDYSVNLSVASSGSVAAARYESLATGSFVVRTQRASNDSQQDADFSFEVLGTLA